MPEAPGLVILWDIGKMFMEQIEEDENLPPGRERAGNVGEWKLKPG
jgi:hypothetical protein